MNMLKSKLVVVTVISAAMALLITACKPAEEATPQSPAPAVTNVAPIIEPVASTNVPVSTNTPAAFLTPAQAREHIGEQATVRGEVSDVHVTQKGDVFMNFGGKHPNSVFTAVCFKSAIPSEQLTALKGKTISVSGKIKEYNGQVEIVLESASQISE